MEKIKTWFKVYGGYVLAGVLAVVGFLVGREFPRRNDPDIEGLRQRIGELRGQLDEYKRRLELSGALHEDTRQRLALAEAELVEARTTVDRIGTGSAGVDADLAELRAVRDRLAKLAERYGAEIGKDSGLQ